MTLSRSAPETDRDVIAAPELDPGFVRHLAAILHPHRQESVRIAAALVEVQRPEGTLAAAFAGATAVNTRTDARVGMANARVKREILYGV